MTRQNLRSPVQAAAVFAVGLACALGTALPLSAQGEPLTPLLEKIGQGDRDMLAASAPIADVELITTEGSPNDALWAAMAKLGWMAEKAPPEGGPVSVKLKVYAITPAGNKEIPSLLQKAAKP